MPTPNIGALRAVADRLNGVGLTYAFVGGSIVNLLLDDPHLSPARPTDDVDVIIEIATSERYSDVEARLRASGFDHDMRVGAPRCRWTLGALTVDIMPTDGAFLGLNTNLFAEALASATEQEFAHTKLRLVSPVGFIATKYVAFLDRGEGDYYASHDLEDLVTVIDGRADIVAEVDWASPGLRDYAITAVRTLTTAAAFSEALPGYLPSDPGSQQRLPSLRRKLQQISELSAGRTI